MSSSSSSATPSSVSSVVPAGADVALWILFESDGRYADVFAADARWLLRPVAELLGRHYSEALPPALANEFASVWQRLVATGREQSFHYSLPFGEVVRKFAASLTLGLGGRVLAIVRKLPPDGAAETEAASASDRLRAVSEAAGLGAWEWSAATGSVWRDDRLLQIFGVSNLGCDVGSWAALIHPDDRAGAVHRAESAITDPSCHGYEHSYRIVRPDGATRWLHTQAVLQRDVHGQATRVVGVDADCTAEQEQAERARIVSDRLLLAAQAAEFGVWDWDVARDHVVWDRRMCALYQAPEAGTVPFSELWSRRVHPDDLARVRSEVETVLAHGDRLDTEFRVIWPDGTVRHIKDDAIVQRDPAGRPIRLIGLNRDVTADREREAELVRARQAAEAASLAKSAFLATVSHELRTPLNGILGFASLLADTKLPPEQAEYVGYISHSSELLLTLINDLLDLSRIEAGKLTFEARPFNLRELIEGVVRLLGPRSAEKSLRVSTRWNATVPASFKGDAGRVRQVVTNLLGNAVKFTQQGSVTIEIAPASDGLVRISVTDTGIGIPRERQPFLFQKFTQADSTTARRFGGSGLGLAISKQLVELMGGEIGLASEPGQGSTFWFTLPPEPPAAGRVS